MGDNHTHDDADWPYPHPKQPDTEDANFTDQMAMAEAVCELLIDKGIFTGDDMRKMVELIDSKSPAEGARMVARAWTDPAFKSRMMKDVNRAAEELDIDAGTIPIRCVENTPEVHNVIVCTLCSCYPRFLLGLPPDWYKSREYRSRVISEPRAVLAEFGTVIADDVETRVHDSTADLRYMVLPMRPQGAEDMDEIALAKLVTRDTMIGVAVIKDL